MVTFLRVFSGTKSQKAALAGLAAAVTVFSYLGFMAAREQAPFLNFSVVEEGKLYRSAQPEPGDLDRLLKEKGIRTIICLRGKAEKQERRWARQRGVKVISMKMKADDPPTPEQLELFFAIMQGDTIELSRYKGVIRNLVGVDRKTEAVKFPLPALIHCEGGADRTGVMVALYRIAFQGWSVDQAKREMLRHFHIPFAHPALFDFLEREGPKWQGRFVPSATRGEAMP